MMCHVGTNGDAALIRRETRWCVIDRLVKPESAFASIASQALKIFTRFPRRYQQRQRGGIRRDDQIFGQATFQTQPWHTEGAILINLMCIALVKCRFGTAPRDSLRIAVFALQ